MEELTIEEKTLISSLVTNRLTYLQRDFMRINKRLNMCDSEYGRENEERFLKEAQDNIDLCFSVLTKIRTKN